MSVNFIRRCGWGSLFGLGLSLGFGAALGTPLAVWLRLLVHFVSAAILLTLLLTFLEQNQPVSLCLAAYGALMAVLWSGVDLLTSFAEIHHEIQMFPDASHIHVPVDWWQSPWFWPGPLFFGLFLMTVALVIILLSPPK